MEYSLINYKKVRSSSKRQTKLKLSDTTTLRCILLWGIIIMSQFLIPPTLAEDDNDGTTNRSNSISGKFFDYMNNFRSASPSNSESSLEPSSISGKNSSNSSLLGNYFRDSSSFQEVYQRFLDQVRKVRGMLSRNNSTESSSSETETATDASINYTSPQNSSSGRSGRINGPYSWGWPQWMSSSPTPNPTTSGSGSRTPLTRIFLSPFDNGGGTGNTIPVTGYSPNSGGGYYPPAPPGPGASLFGPGSPSQTHFNYVYKYNPKTNTATDLEQHTTTTIYIICICLVIMLVGTILFAFVSKCQEASGRTVGGTSNTAIPAPRSRRRRGQGHQGHASSNNNSVTSVSTEISMTSRPEISIIMPSGDLPPAYPKVIYDPPPAYDSLFPVELGKQ